MNNRKALLVGIDHYDPPRQELHSCVSDVKKLSSMLRENEDLSPNFHCQELVSANTRITEALLRRKVRDLFKDQVDVALFYFSGHGFTDEYGSFLITQDAVQDDEGINMMEIIDIAQRSKAKEKIIILDCCSAGNMGTMDTGSAQIPTGLSILASSGPGQSSIARAGGSEFTNIVVEALAGKAADILGVVTVAGIFHLADSLLSPWEQRPQFKANISQMTPIRRCKPKIDLNILRKLPLYFKEAHALYPVSPEYDDEQEPRHLAKEAIFAEFRKLHRLNLLDPVGEEFLYHAAQKSKACALTLQGKYYWKLAKKNKI